MARTATTARTASYWGSGLPGLGARFAGGLVLLAAIGLAAAPARAQTAGAAGATLGLMSVIRLGQTGPWTKSVAGGWFIMSNSSDSNAIYYFHIHWKRTRIEGRAASVIVLVKGDAQAQAGLFLVNGADSHKWVALMLGGDGRIGLYLHDAQHGLTLGKMVGQAGPGDTDGVVLTIAQNTARTEFRVDHKVVMSIGSHYRVGVPHGGLPVELVGIGSARVGTFGFRQFRFVPVGMPTPAAQPAPAPQPVPGPQQVPEPQTPPAQSPFPPAGAPPAAENPFPPAGAPPAALSPFPPAGAPPAAQSPFPPAGAPPAAQNPFPPAGAPAAPGPAPAGNGQGLTLQQFFVGGAWRSVTHSAQGTEETDFRFKADGTFSERDRFTGQSGQVISIVISGRWNVQPIQGSEVQISIQPQQAYPPQICGANGACRPVPLNTAQFQVKLLGRNTISYNGQTVQRVP